MDERIQLIPLSLENVDLQTRQYMDESVNVKGECGSLVLRRHLRQAQDCVTLRDLMTLHRRRHSLGERQDLEIHHQVRQHPLRRPPLRPRALNQTQDLIRMDGVGLQGTHRTQGRRRTRVRTGPNGISAKRSVVFALHLASLSPTRSDSFMFDKGTRLPNACATCFELQVFHNLLLTKYNMLWIVAEVAVNGNASLTDLWHHFLSRLASTRLVHSTFCFSTI